MIEGERRIKITDVTQVSFGSIGPDGREIDGCEINYEALNGGQEETQGSLESEPGPLPGAAGRIALYESLALN